MNKKRRQTINPLSKYKRDDNIESEKMVEKERKRCSKVEGRRGK